MKRILMLSHWSVRLACAAVSLFLISTVHAADHRDGPRFGPAVAEIGAMDANDLFIFRSPANPANTVLIMTVSPFAGQLTPDTFDSRLRYELRIDQDRNFTPDLSLRISFGPPDANGQQVKLTASRPGRAAETLATGNTNTNLPIEGGGMFRAGIQDDPFFFDMTGFAMLVDDGVGTFPRPGGQAQNFFGPNVNTLAITLEMPARMLLKSADRPVINAWIRTADAAGTQFDRAAQPFLNQFLIPPVPRNNPALRDRRNAFNRGDPTRDLRLFRSDVLSTLTGFWGNAPGRAGALVDRLLLPNVLTFDASFTFEPSNGGYPNGRRLRDDVADFVLNLLSNGAIPTDNVSDDNGDRITDGSTRPDGSLRPIAFPYIGPPNP